MAFLSERRKIIFGGFVPTSENISVSRFHVLHSRIFYLLWLRVFLHFVGTLIENHLCPLEHVSVIF